MTNACNGVMVGSRRSVKISWLGASNATMTGGWGAMPPPNSVEMLRRQRCSPLLVDYSSLP